MRQLLLLLAFPAVLAACGGSSGGAEPPMQPATTADTGTGATTTAPAAGSLRARLAKKPGPDVGLILGTSDLTVGENRISFLVVDNKGRVVESKRAKLLAAPTSLDEEPVAHTVAHMRVLDPLPDSDPNAIQSPAPDTKALYVGTLKFPKPGRYWLVAEPAGEKIQAMGVVDVRATPRAPAVGSKAIPSDNPTLGDGPIQTLTTAKPPDRGLLRYSVKESLAAKKPFVVVFATPQYCTSRTCGPTVEIVDTVRRQLAATDVRFIHVEVYEDNDPQKGVNEWMREWHLPSEPWIFVVDRKGVIRTRFEGSASVEELVDAVTEVAS